MPNRASQDSMILRDRAHRAPWGGTRAQAVRARAGSVPPDDTAARRASRAAGAQGRLPAGTTPCPDPRLEPRTHAQLARTPFGRASHRPSAPGSAPRAATVGSGLPHHAPTAALPAGMVALALPTATAGANARRGTTARQAPPPRQVPSRPRRAVAATTTARRDRGPARQFRPGTTLLVDLPQPAPDNFLASKVPTAAKASRVAVLPAGTAAKLCFGRAHAQGNAPPGSTALSGLSPASRRTAGAWTNTARPDPVAQRK